MDKEKISFKRIVIFVLAAVIIVLTIVEAVKKKNKDVTSELPQGWDVQSYDEYMKSKKDTPSDIEGLSQYDKYKMGLNYRDGSDTDFDGLTDKEEIEVYHTDPLKASTAGDLYTDGYKIANGMDPLTPAEYDKEVSFEYNQCPEIALEADEPTDLYAVVEEYTDVESLEDFGIEEIFAGYSLYNYNGSITIDLTRILKRNDIDISDVHIWITEGDFLISGASELKEATYQVSGDQITIDEELNNRNSYLLFVAGPQKLSAGSSLLGKIGLADSSSKEEGLILVMGSPALNALFHNGISVDYSELDSDQKTNVFFNNAKEWYKKDVLLQNTDEKNLYHYDEKNMHKQTKTYIKLKYDILTHLFPNVESQFDTVEKKEVSILGVLFTYGIHRMMIDDSDEMLVSAELDGDSTGEAGKDRDSNSNRHTDFDKYTDELPFQNFESSIGVAGNCAGIAHLTSYLYNTGSFPSSGSYDSIEWNLGADPENETLTNKGLSDYKDRLFVDNHSDTGNNYLGIGLTDGEQQFVNMIGSYWEEGNDKVLLEEHLKEYSNENDFTMIEKAMDYIDQGKIVDAYMLFRAGYGHAVNLYDYFYTNTGEIIFRVYDSNIPHDNRNGIELKHAFCYLHVKELKNPDGSSAFTYLYNPIKDDHGYLATSNHTFMQENALVIMDENWNTF